MNDEISLSSKEQFEIFLFIQFFFCNFTNLTPILIPLHTKHCSGRIFYFHIDF